MPRDKLPDNNKEIILKSTPIDVCLPVVAVVSNPCFYKIRYKLANEFIARMQKEPNVDLYVVELVYNDQEFAITSANNDKHLQIRTNTPPLWHKENMINMGIRKLLPANWKAVAWIDADVEFESANWVMDTLKVLRGKDFVQLFTHCIDMDYNEEIMNLFTGFAYQYCSKFKKGTGVNYWHPGFAWACTREAYDKMGGIYDNGILGSGDNIMCHTFTKKAPDTLKKGTSPKYFDSVAKLQERMDGLKLGYVPGPIRHYFHGKKVNRKYLEREDILIKFQYDPYNHMTRDSNGLIIPTAECPQEFLDEVMNYFKNRNEDEMVLEEMNKPVVHPVTGSPLIQPQIQPQIEKNTHYKGIDATEKKMLQQFPLEFKVQFILEEFEKLKNDEISKLVKIKYTVQK